MTVGQASWAFNHSVSSLTSSAASSFCGIKGGTTQVGLERVRWEGHGVRYSADDFWQGAATYPLPNST